MFQNFYDMMVEEQMLTINLMKKGDKLVVCVLPRSEKVKDTAQQYFTPLNLEGTPAELDAGFIAAIANPVKKVSGMLKNMADFEEKAEKAAVESKALKEKTDKINKMIKDAEALEKDKPKEALAVYNKVLEQDKYNQKIISKIVALQEKTMQGNLFAGETDGVSAMKETVPVGNTQQTEQPAQSIIEIKPATENNITAAKTGSAMDMFEQAVKVNETIVAEQKPEPTPTPTDVNPAIAGMSPEMLAQFRQFMAFQQQQGNNNQ